MLNLFLFATGEQGEQTLPEYFRQTPRVYSEYKGGGPAETEGRS